MDAEQAAETVDIGVAGVRIGHHTDGRARTGCTVVRIDRPNVASGEVRGGAPATREFALLDPRRTVGGIDAVVLSGGSAFGLATCDGVVAELAEEGVGVETRHGVVPIVVGLALYDLGVGDSESRPDAAAGRAALATASSNATVGNVGAGTGATVGTWRGPDRRRPGGLGIARIASGDLVVSAVVAVNAAGDLVSESGDEDIIGAVAAGTFDWPPDDGLVSENTTIGVIVTNAALDKTGCRLVAEAGHDGMARAIVPAHTPFDGDALVAVSCGDVATSLSRVRLMAATAVDRAIASLRGP